MLKPFLFEKESLSFKLSISSFSSSWLEVIEVIPKFAQQLMEINCSAHLDRVSNALDLGSVSCFPNLLWLFRRLSFSCDISLGSLYWRLAKIS